MKSKTWLNKVELQFQAFYLINNRWLFSATYWFKFQDSVIRILCWIFKEKCCKIKITQVKTFLFYKIQGWTKCSPFPKCKYLIFMLLSKFLIHYLSLLYLFSKTLTWAELKYFTCWARIKYNENCEEIWKPCKHHLLLRWNMEHWTSNFKENESPYMCAVVIQCLFLQLNLILLYCPKLSYSDQLSCMFIFMKQNSHISVTS